MVKTNLTRGAINKKLYPELGILAWCGISSAVVHQMSFRRETCGGIVKYWLFPQASSVAKIVFLQTGHKRILNSFY